MYDTQNTMHRITTTSKIDLFVEQLITGHYSQKEILQKF